MWSRIIYIYLHSDHCPRLVMITTFRPLCCPAFIKCLLIIRVTFKGLSKGLCSKFLQGCPSLWANNSQSLNNVSIKLIRYSRNSDSVLFTNVELIISVFT